MVSLGVVAVSLLLLFTGTYITMDNLEVEISAEEVTCLPGSVEQWSNPLNEDGSRIWHYEETDNCGVNS